jgi:mono/diheme cytochrome c family protein
VPVTGFSRSADEETASVRVSKLGAAIILAMAVGPALGQDAVTNASSGVFTEEQAERGRQTYVANCGSCHGPRLVPSNEDYPALVGPAFAYSWHGQSLAERFERVYFTMPYNAPESLTDDQVSDLLAFILMTNGYPAGEAELATDLDTLGTIVIDPLP